MPVANAACSVTTATSGPPHPQRSLWCRVLVSEGAQLFGRLAVIADQIHAVVDRIYYWVDVRGIRFNHTSYGGVQVRSVGRSKGDDLAFGICEILPFQTSQVWLVPGQFELHPAPHGTV